MGKSDHIVSRRAATRWMKQRRILMLFGWVCSIVAGCAAPQVRGVATAPRPPDPITLALHADATHTILALGVQDLDRTTERLLGTLESLPEPSRRALESIGSRAKLTEKLGFDPTRRAAWDDVGVDPSAGALLLLDDRWPGPAPGAKGPAAGTRQIVVFLRLTDRGKWTQKIQHAGAALTHEGVVDVVRLRETTLWVTASGDDIAVTPVPQFANDSDKTLFLKSFLQIATLPTQPLPAHAKWQGVMHDAGRPWLFAWADSARVAVTEPVPRNGGPESMERFYASLFPAIAGWLSDHWALKLLTQPTSHGALAEMFEPAKLPPACSPLLPATGWAAGRLSVRLDTLTTGLLRLVPPQTGAGQRAILAASVDTGLALATGLPAAEIRAAWSGHLCAGVNLASVPEALRGATSPEFLVVLGVEDERRADATLAALANHWKMQMNVPIQNATIGGMPGYAARVGIWELAVVRDHDRVLVGSGPDAVVAALARQAGPNLAGAGMGDALDGRVIAGLVVDLRTLFDVVGSAVQPVTGHDDRTQQVLESLGTALGGTRFFALALRLEADALALGSGQTADSGISGPLLVGILAALAIPAFQKFSARSKSAEATVNLRQMRRLAVAFWQAEHVDPQTGKVVPPRFPQSTALTPTASCCDPSVDRDGDQRCDENPAFWQQTGWKEMGFQPGGQHRFRYRIESSGSGNQASLVMTATGDVDCDGRESTYTMTGRPCVGKSCKDVWTWEDRAVQATE